MTSIAVHTRAWAERAATATQDRVERLDAVCPEAREEDAREAAEPFAHEGAVGRGGRGEGVGNPERVSDDDQQDEPRRPEDDHIHGEAGDGRTRRPENRPEVALLQEAEVPYLAPTRERPGPAVPVRPAPPVVDLVDRVGDPALHEPGEGQGDRQERGIEGPMFREDEGGAQADGGEGPQEHRDYAELQEPAAGLSDDQRAPLVFGQPNDYCDSNISRLCDKGSR